MRESKIERALVKRCKKVGAATFKFVSPGMAGVPDRIVIDDGHVMFVECKAPGKKLRKLQQRVRRIIERAGGDYFRIDSVKDIDYIVPEERDDD